MKDCCKKSYDDGLQKGKEIGKQDVLNNYTDFKFLKDLDTMAFHRGERSQVSKIAELEKENRELKEQNSKLADDFFYIFQLTQRRKRLRGEK